MNNSKEINTRRWWRFAIWGVMLGWLVMSSAPVQAQTNTTVYVVGNGGQFGYFDLTTRAYTEISSNAFVGIQTTGLAYRSTTGTMYLNARYGGTTALHTINPATGVSTLVATYNYGGAASDTIGLAFNSAGNLFNYNYGNDAIFSVDPATAVGTQTAHSGLTSASPLAGKLAFAGSTLYGAMSLTPSSANGLYSFNTTTGASTFIGNGGVASTYTNMIVFANGANLYGIVGITLYSINTVNGNLTALGVISGISLPSGFSGAVVGPTITPATPTATTTTTPTALPTATATATATTTPTNPPTATATSTATATATPTATETPVPTATSTATATATATATETLVPTATSTATATDTPTATATPTATETPVPTATATPTDLPTATATETPVPTVTSTATAADTPTATSTATATETPAATATATHTPLPTATPTATQTATATATSTATATETSVPTATATATMPVTPTATATDLPTATATATDLPTTTPTALPTATPTPTMTATATLVPTATPTPTIAPTGTPTGTPTATNTLAPPTATPTPTVTATATPTQTGTPTVTSTPSGTATAIAPATPTATNTLAPPTATSTATATATATATVLPTATTPPAVIGDLVWHDQNGDGLQNVGEPPLAGITVTLYSTGTGSVDGIMSRTALTGTVVMTAVTQLDGRYAFTTWTPGRYFIAFASPAFYVPTLCNQGSEEAVDSDACRLDLTEIGQTGSFTITNPPTQVDWDAGFTFPATIRGRTYLDTDRDNEQDVGEAPLAGVTIILQEGASAQQRKGFLLTAAGRELARAVTDAAGAYRFANLTPGRYQLAVVVPTGYMATTTQITLPWLTTGELLSENAGLVALQPTNLAEAPEPRYRLYLPLAQSE